MAPVVPPEPSLKRSSSSLSDGLDESAPKRQKRIYHHHHSLLTPVRLALTEAAITDSVAVDQLLKRSIGQMLAQAGFDLADPVALDSFRNATEEYMLKFASHVRQSMLACRRVQPIPHDFEHALRRSAVSVDDLPAYLTAPPAVEPAPALLPSPPPDEDPFAGLPFLDATLSGEEDRARSAYIPKHFPAFPSRHTYRHTPVFTQREHDPRRIRERATEDGRLGEEALRKLARAAFKDSQTTGGAGGREKKLWGRRNEDLETMFERTVRGLLKKAQRNAPDAASNTAPSMELDPGPGPSGQPKPSRPKLPLSLELGPIVNCERDFWRKSAKKAEKAENVKKMAETKADAAKEAGVVRAEGVVTS